MNGHRKNEITETTPLGAGVTDEKTILLDNGAWKKMQPHSESSDRVRNRPEAPSYLFFSSCSPVALVGLYLSEASRKTNQHNKLLLQVMVGN
jgi:hypothetical protein